MELGHKLEQRLDYSCKFPFVQEEFVLNLCFVKNSKGRDSRHESLLHI